MPPVRIVSRLGTMLAIAALSGVPASAQTGRSAVMSARDSSAVAVERDIWENILHGRWDRVNATLVGALTAQGSGISVWNTAATDRLRGCTLTNYALHDMTTRDVGADVVVLAYRAALSMKCGNGTAMALPPIYYMSVYRRAGKAWKLEATSITQADRPK